MGTAIWWCWSLLQQTRSILFHPHQFTVLPLKCQHNRGEWIKDWVLHFQCLTSSPALSTSCQHLHRTGEMNSWAPFLLLQARQSHLHSPEVPVPQCHPAWGLVLVQDYSKVRILHFLRSSKNRWPSAIAFWNQPQEDISHWKILEQC